MVSSILRRVSGKTAAIANARGIDPATNSLPRGLSNLATNSLNTRISSSPWLMLPPSYEGNNNNIMAFNFYSFADNTVKKFFLERVRILVNEVDDIKFVSSSHGWLALFNRRNHDLFLFNPISGRQLMLPPIQPLNMAGVKISNVTKVITSCSPEEEDCRVMMSFGQLRKLAFCSPTSSEWTPIGDLYYEDDGDNLPILRGGYHRANGKAHPVLLHSFDAKENPQPYLRGYQDFVHSTTENIFYCIDSRMGFEYWDLKDNLYPKTFQFDPFLDLDTYPWPVQSYDEFKLKTNCKTLTFLVVEEESGDIFWVIRHVMPHMTLDGSHVSCCYIYRRKYPYKTIGFDVHKYDRERDAMVYMDGSLDGLALFIGTNQSFAISASEFPELQPNSIYFTDVHQETLKLEEDSVTGGDVIPEKKPFGGHDIGIFNYENKSFSPTCYYPCDRPNVKRIMPAPMWFTPKY